MARTDLSAETVVTMTCPETPNERPRQRHAGLAANRMIQRLVSSCTRLVVLALCLSFGTTAWSASLTITVTGLPNAEGHVRIGVCTRPEFLAERCSYHAIVSAKPGTITTTIQDVVPGAYAVAAYQDETDLGRMRRNLFGIPQNAAGFSRDPKIGYGPPSFNECALQIGARDAAITITLRSH